MKRSLWLCLTISVLALAACNTVEGVGRDISGGANAVRGWFGH
ncbi:hypothetical protein [Pararhodobacter sp.]|nr:hypothetical protein [Pararhodobacter sp.]